LRRGAQRTVRFLVQQLLAGPVRTLVALGWLHLEQLCRVLISRELVLKCIALQILLFLPLACAIE
jgi:hypothetical protein